MKYTNFEPASLLESLKSHFAESSHRTLRNWIRWGRVLVDGEPLLNANALLCSDQVITLKKKEDIGFPFPILYQDRYCIVINKPCGLLSVPDASDETSALEILKAQLKSPVFAVHRLDKETSGVLLFAKGRLAEEAFDNLFEKRAIKRTYAAIIEGHLSQNQGVWESYLKEKENYDVVSTSEKEGKKAITHYQVLRHSKKFSYLEISLETGRKHQIRVQASAIGHPILGDFRYGSLTDPLKRLGLHACKLEFFHPFLKKSLTVLAPLPKAFLALGFPS